MNQTLRKELSRTVKGNKETIVNEIHKLELFTDEDLQELHDNFLDDLEEGYYSGVAIDFDDNIIWIDIDSLTSYLEYYIANSDEEEEESYRYIVFKKLLNKIYKWSGYRVEVR